MTSRRSEDLGFKALTPDNWREPDETSQQFARRSEIAGMVAMNDVDWARAILSKQLDARKVLAAAAGSTRSAASGESAPNR